MHFRMGRGPSIAFVPLPSIMGKRSRAYPAGPGSPILFFVHMAPLPTYGFEAWFPKRANSGNDFLFRFDLRPRPTLIRGPLQQHRMTLTDCSDGIGIACCPSYDLHRHAIPEHDPISGKPSGSGHATLYVYPCRILGIASRHARRHRKDRSNQSERRANLFARARSCYFFARLPLALFSSTHGWHLHRMRLTGRNVSPHCLHVRGL